MKKTLLLLLILALLNIPFSAFAETLKFPDVDHDNIYAEAINYLAQKDIIHGRDDGLFHPEMEITRVEALKIIYDLKKVYIQKSIPSNKTFPDIENDKWYAKYIYTAKRKRTISGFDDGKFWPDRNITRAESCKIILGTYGVRIRNIHKSFAKLHNYKDIPNDKWYSSCVGFAKFYNLFKFEGNNFEPGKHITREEFAYFAYKTDLFNEIGKLAKVKPEIEEDVEYLSSEISLADIPEEYQDKLEIVTEGIASYYGDSFNGRGTASGAKFDNSKLMAAHPLLPFNSFVRVTNTSNNKFIDVEILDCGPFAKGRVIDLSKKAFKEISSLGAGLANVKIEVMKLGPKKWQNRCFDLTQKRW